MSIYLVSVENNLFRHVDFEVGMDTGKELNARWMKKRDLFIKLLSIFHASRVYEKVSNVGWVKQGENEWYYWRHRDSKLA